MGREPLLDLADDLFKARYNRNFVEEIDTIIVENLDFVVIDKSDFLKIKSRLDRLRLYEQECKPAGVYYGKEAIT